MVGNHLSASYLCFCYSCYHFLVLFFLVTQALKFRVAGSIQLFLLKGNYYAFNYASRALYGWTRMLLDSYVLLFAFLQNRGMYRRLDSKSGIGKELGRTLN